MGNRKIKKIDIPITEEELHELLHEDAEFDWEFDGVQVHIHKQEDEEY